MDMETDDPYAPGAVWVHSGSRTPVLLVGTIQDDHGVTPGFEPGTVFVLTTTRDQTVHLHDSWPVGLFVELFVRPDGSAPMFPGFPRQRTGEV